MDMKSILLQPLRIDMKKLFSLVIIVLSLTGCAPQVLTSTKEEVILPPTSLYNCPVPGQLPSASTLTDVEVAQTLTRLYTNNILCKNSEIAIQNFMNKAAYDVQINQ